MMTLHANDGHFKDENNTALFQIIVESMGRETSQELQARDLHTAAPGLERKLARNHHFKFQKVTIHEGIR